MWRKIFLILLLIAVVLGVAIWRSPGDFLFFGKNEVVKIENPVPQGTKIQPPVAPEEKAAAPKIVPNKVPQSSLIENVPFTVQAPFGEWSNPTFQDGCEEASLIMAAYWLSGKPLSQETAKQEITALARFEEKKLGQSIDTSAKDTEAIFREYYGVTTSEVQTDIKVEDIGEALASGAIVLVPADGRKLQNPNFHQPGPTTHMVVVIGYDAQKKEFITNDPGTRNGKGYRYKEAGFYEAIQDYPTGGHLPVQGVHKDMIVIRKP